MSFGVVPAVRLAGTGFAEAHIVLMTGRHIGPNKGFGSRHVWAEHRAEILRAGYQEEPDVAHYILDMLLPGTPLYFEGASWRNTRLMAVRSSRGTAVLEARDRREGLIWSVVTAFSGTKAHGTRVGTVR